MLQGYILGDHIGQPSPQLDGDCPHGKRPELVGLDLLERVGSQYDSGCVLQKLSRDDKMILSLIYRYFFGIHPSFA